MRKIVTQFLRPLRPYEEIRYTNTISTVREQEVAVKIEEIFQWRLLDRPKKVKES
jgi:hypothetical protein